MHHGIGHMVGYCPAPSHVYPSAGHQTLGPTPVLVTSSGDHWGPVQINLVHLGPTSPSLPPGVTSGGGN